MRKGMMPHTIDLYAAVRIATEMRSRIPLEWLDRVAILVTGDERILIDMQAAVVGVDSILDRQVGRVVTVAGIPLLEDPRREIRS